MAIQGKHLKLYRGWPDRGEYVWSPFVVKLEARLRFAGVAYSREAGSPKTAPKGKIPYVEFPGPEGAGPIRMGDSALITKHFVEQGVLPDLNGSLSMEDKTRDLATRALLEDRLFFFQVGHHHKYVGRGTYVKRLTWLSQTRERWIGNFYTMRDYAMSSIPWPLRVLIGQLAYRNVKATLYGQGTLRFSEDEARLTKIEIWESISEVLVFERSKSSPSRITRAAKPSSELFWYLGGDKPTEVDATLFGFIVSVLLCKA